MTHHPVRTIVIWSGILIIIQIGLLWVMRQPWICACDSIHLWVSDIFSSQMSQHLFDWYSFSHVIHGFLFFMILRLMFPRLSWGYRLLCALAIEIGWEVAENTPYVINAYREQALAQGYVGDSIINSVMDTLSMVAGFIMASRLSVWLIVVVAIVFELFVAFYIHDNLSLNILNFIYPLDSVTAWQAQMMP